MLKIWAILIGTDGIRLSGFDLGVAHLATDFRYKNVLKIWAMLIAPHITHLPGVYLSFFSLGPVYFLCIHYRRLRVLVSWCFEGPFDMYRMC